MGVKAFVDTNILIRALLIYMPSHHEADELIKRMVRDDVELWVSGQIIREFIVQATHPKTLRIPLSIDQVLHEVYVIEQLFQVADESAIVRKQLLELLQHFPTQGKQIHDANIVATMLVNRIDKLLTFNVSDFKRFSSKIEIVAP